MSVMALTRVGRRVYATEAARRRIAAEQRADSARARSQHAEALADRPAGAFLVAKGAASRRTPPTDFRRQRSGSCSLILSRLTEVPERQRAKPMDPSPADRAASAAEHARSLIQENAAHLSSVLNRTAETLGKTAAIAEEHARRRDRAGLSEAAREERRVAERAREYAQRARSQAEEWLKLATRHTR
jgi:hypothetical protein